MKRTNHKQIVKLAVAFLIALVNADDSGWSARARTAKNALDEAFDALVN